MKLNTQTLLIGGLIVVGGAFLFKKQICSRMQIPFLCDIVPWGGGTQQTEAGTRYLAGPDDLPPA